MKGTSWVHVLTSPPPLTQRWLLVFPDGPQHLGRSWEEADTPRHPLLAPAQVPLSFRDVLPKSRVLQDALALVGVCPSPCLSRSPSPAALTVSRQLLPCLLNGSERLIRQGLLRVPTRGAGHRPGAQAAAAPHPPPPSGDRSPSALPAVLTPPSLSAGHPVPSRADSSSWLLHPLPALRAGPRARPAPTLPQSPVLTPDLSVLSHCCSWGWWPPSAWA